MPNKRGDFRLNFYRINAAFNTAAIALKEFRPEYAGHRTPFRYSLIRCCPVVLLRATLRI
jgi:hypothetical protein